MLEINGLVKHYGDFTLNYPKLQDIFRQKPWKM